MPATEATDDRPLPTIWALPDELWERVEPILARHYPPAPTGRPRADLRRVLDGIVYRLRSGVQWNQLPAQFGASSTVHDWFQRFVRDGLLREIWAALVGECDQLGEVGWEWQAVDGVMGKSRFCGDKRGPNPTDRGGTLGGQAASPRRPRRLRGRKALDPGPRPQAFLAARRPRRGAKGRARVRAPGGALLPGRLGRSPRSRLRSLRAQGRDRALRSPRRAVHVGRALRLRATRVRGRRQRLRPSRPALDRSPPRRLAEPDLGPRRSTRAGSTRWRSTPRSFSARSSSPTTSPTSASSRSGCSPFGSRYERIAEPFEWKFTCRDLNRQLARLDATGGPSALHAA